MTISKQDVLNAISNCSAEIVAKLTETIEMNTGVLPEKNKQTLQTDIQNWLSHAAPTFKLSPEALTFIQHDKKPYNMQSDKLVLENHHCTTDGTTYYAREASWTGSLSDSRRIAPISGEEFKALKQRFPDVHILRTSID